MKPSLAKKRPPGEDRRALAAREGANREEECALNTPALSLN
jgi:hypothetical protein